MFKIYSVSRHGGLIEREALSETERSYALRDGHRVRKDADFHQWRPSAAEAYRARIALESAYADSLRRRLAVQEAFTAALRAKLAEVEG